MAQVVALYRYPIKGFTPEPCDALTVLPSGRVMGDRVLGFKFADTPEPDDAWSRKTGMLALVNTPGLARLRVRFAPATPPGVGRLTITADGEVVADAALDAAGRSSIIDAVAAFVLSLEDGPLAGHPERLPLRLVGDGVTPRYTDHPEGQVTLHGRASLEALRVALADSEASELRFRSNVVLDGLEPWEELSWVGRRLRIGTVEFEVGRGAIRCLATHANPETGQADRPILTTLTDAFGQDRPTFGVAMTPQGPGEIRVGDSVQLLGAAG